MTSIIFIIGFIDDLHFFSKEFFDKMTNFMSALIDGDEPNEGTEGTLIIHKICQKLKSDEVILLLILQNLMRCIACDL